MLLNIKLFMLLSYLLSFMKEEIIIFLSCAHFIVFFYSLTSIYSIYTHGLTHSDVESLLK